MKEKFLNLLTKRKTVTAAMAVLIAYTVFATVGVIMRNLELKQDIARTQQEIEVLTLENENLRHNIEYFRSEAYIEEVLREQLGYAKPGETILVFPDEEMKKEEIKKEDKNMSFEEQRKANLEEWLRFLFKEQ